MNFDLKIYDNEISKNICNFINFLFMSTYDTNVVLDDAYRRLSNQPKTVINGKKALIRVDFNVPITNGKIDDDSRIKGALPTIQYLLENNCSIVILSHLGRPKGKVVKDLKLDVVGKRLEELLGKKVTKLDECIGNEVQNAKKKLKPGEILLLENTRFYSEETHNLAPFARELAENMDFFVQDAFGCVHRAHASVEGVTHFLPSMMGFLVEKEFENLKGVFINKKKPLTLLIGGAKIDTKIGVIRNFLPIADTILIGGGLANTFLNAKGYDVKNSLVELDKAKLALEILQDAGEEACQIMLPRDFVVSKEISETAETRILNRKEGEQMEDGEKILDIGPETIKRFSEVIKNSQTIVWNGPVGLFEFTPFSSGTKQLGKAIEENNHITIVGGGDSVDAINRFKFDKNKFSHISTGGGAMLEFLEGKMLPGISALKKHLDL